MKGELTEKQRTVIGIFLLTVLGAFIGWVYEMIFYRIDLGYFIKRGHGFGPWLPIYAFGALGLTLIVYKKKLHPAVLFFLSMIGSGIIEYATGWLLFNLMGGVRLWDYNVEIWNWGNIDGFVCARSVLIFGVFGMVYGALVIPRFTAWIKKAKARPLMIFSAVLAVVVFADVIYGYIIKSIMNGGL
ncbi:MAG: putative ABC transporter permease [Lachnospiraceae bacterium]|nr:putative ABC transporter permease [Lachnospiraceae bacterium]